jgi:hypothetical protein
MAGNTGQAAKPLTRKFIASHELPNGGAFRKIVVPSVLPLPTTVSDGGLLSGEGCVAERYSILSGSSLLFGQARSIGSSPELDGLSAMTYRPDSASGQRATPNLLTANHATSAATAAATVAKSAIVGNAASMPFQKDPRRLFRGLGCWSSLVNSLKFSAASLFPDC